MLIFDNARSFETPRINNHSITAPRALIFLGDENEQYFETPPKNHSVTAPSAQILSGYDSPKFQHNIRTHRPGQKLMDWEIAHAAQCYKSRASTKVIYLILDIESFEQQCFILKWLLQSWRLK